MEVGKQENVEYKTKTKFALIDPARSIAIMYTH